MAPRKRPRAPPLAAGADLRERYACPFPIYSEEEGNSYAKIIDKPVNPPKIIDWDMVRTLGIYHDFVRYLSNLGCLPFAQMNLLAFRDLCHEMLVTFYLYPSGRRASCRLRGQVVDLTLDSMHECFGFSNDEGDHFGPPVTFNASSAWHELTGFWNWENKGVSNGFLRDPALLVLHRFLAANVMGKADLSKVNEAECFLLLAALKGTPVSLSGFIFSQLRQLTRKATNHPAFAHIATQLAIHFQLVHEGDNFVEVAASTLGATELYNGHYLSSDYRRFIPYEQRDCVVALRARERDPNIASTSGAGGSSQPPPRSPAAQPRQPPFSRGPASLEDHFADFQTAMFNRLDEMHAYNVSRFDRLDNSMAAIDARVTSVNDHVQALETQWRQWTGVSSDDDEV